ncbi:MAG: lipocalin family protein [Halieaceae bacterium]
MMRILKQVFNLTRFNRLLIVIATVSVLAGCLAIPEGVEPVTDFDVNRYSGTWYEVARLDHRFERGLSNVTASYSLQDDGTVKVVNRGYNFEDDSWDDAVGKAAFVDATDVGYLKVSFFGPFYGAYAVFELDKQDYQYAFVAGNTTSYLWLLSRTPTVSGTLRQQFIDKTTTLGFDPAGLIWVDQSRHSPADNGTPAG